MVKGDEIYMEFSLNLERMFPTEESRYDAYKKWIIISAVFGPIAWLSGRALESMIRVAGRSYHVSSSFETWFSILSILSILGAVFSLVSFYISIYIAWKSKVIKSCLKMLLGIFIGFFIMAILSHIFPPLSLIVPIMALYMNWARVNRYWNSNDRFVKDNFKLFGMGVLAIICLAIGAVASIATSSFAPFVISMFIALGLWLVWPPVYIINVFNREKELGNTFYKSFYRLNMTGVFIIFSLIALTASIHNNLFDGNGVVDDLTGDISDPTMTGAEHVYTETPDMAAAHITDFSHMDSGMASDYNPYTGYVHPNTTGFTQNVDTNPNPDSFVQDTSMGYDNPDATPFMHNTDIGHTDISSADAHVGFDSTHPDINSHIDGAFVHSSPDLMDGNFMHVYGGTNMVDIPHIQHNPYMIFNDPSAHGNFQVCDPNGMPQMTISNGNIVNSEYKVIGYVNTDAVSGMTTYTDINNNPLYSVDSHGQMFSGNHYIGHTDTSGGVTVIRDMNNNIVARYDELTHTWFDKASKPISQIKMM